MGDRRSRQDLRAGLRGDRNFGSFAGWRYLPDLTFHLLEDGLPGLPAREQKRLHRRRTVLPQPLQSLGDSFESLFQLSTIAAPFTQQPPDRLGSQPFFVEVPGLPDAVERILRDGDPARSAQVGYRVFPQVSVEGWTRNTQQIADLFDGVDASPPAYHANIFEIFTGRHLTI